ncbi:MAG: helix-turn-helix domain-containing protein, partial [Gammaproteobacteria bacterium]|nr:helix-turn-helix domain-containing protein [Gammaproteobacteria bacterium]
MIEPRSTAESLTQVRRGPGERLRAARLKAGHDLDWAAAQLRLRRGVIEALETNDYDNLPPPVFIQGYLRTYSSILGLPQQDILREYRESAGQKSEPSPSGLSEDKKPAKPKSPAAKSVEKPKLPEKAKQPEKAKLPEKAKQSEETGPQEPSLAKPEIRSEASLVPKPQPEQRPEPRPDAS